MNTEIILLASILLIVVLALLPLFIHRTIIATITGFSWTRKIFFEHCLWVEETSYSGFPDDSRNQHSEVEVYYVTQIVAYNTRTTQINGATSTTSEPVYGRVRKKRTKYTYEIQRWFKSRELIAEGDKHYDVHWPAYTLDQSTSEKVDEKKETYLAFFQTAKGKQYKHKFSESDWNALNDTMEYALRVNLYGRVTKLPKVRGMLKSSTYLYNTPQQK